LCLDFAEKGQKRIADNGTRFYQLDRVGAWAEKPNDKNRRPMQKTLTKTEANLHRTDDGISRLVYGNVIPMGIRWETSHGMGQA